MDLRKINRGLSVSPQIDPADLNALQMAGFRAIICNRPDGEESDQPAFAEIEQAARAAGLEARYLPVVGGRMSQSDVDAFDAALSELPGPVLAYCRSGTRSATLWALAERDRGAALPSILEAAAAAGYDLSGNEWIVRPRGAA